MALTLTRTEQAVAWLATAALGAGEQDVDPDGWLLLDITEHEHTKDGWKSPLYRALRRRGFDVRMRQIEGGYETWARWPEED